MARARKVNTDHLELADSLEMWGRAHGVADDPYVAGLTRDLRDNNDLPIWASMDPMQYLPQPAVKSAEAIHQWVRRLTVIRNVLVFAPVALTWLAVGKVHQCMYCPKPRNSIPMTPSKYPAISLRIWISENCA
jgi:hypothetical protein